MNKPKDASLRRNIEEDIDLQPQTELIQYKLVHQHLPLLILPNNNILVYTQTPCFKAIYPFLCSFSEPIDRPKTIHQYKISKFSLYTAMILQYTANDIIAILKKLMKNLKFPKTLQKIIRDYMTMAGRVRMRLKENFYELVTDDQIGSILGEELIQKIGQIQVKSVGTSHFDFVINQEDDLEGQQCQGTTITMNRYKINGNYFKTTQKLIMKNIPLIQQYDFQNDKNKFSINIQMIPGITLRYYQERAIKHVIINSKARSGLIILPCGAGKSLVAILLIQRIKVNTIIICESEISVQQWKDQLLKWTTISANKIVRLTGKHRDKFTRYDPNVIFITTYSMVARKQNQKNPMIQETQKVKWGLCIADQVHKLPANTFQNVLKDYLFNIKIGLTATPYRQDNKINDLYYMIGPKLFQQNWENLVEEGCLAKAYCIQVRCRMSPKFLEQYNLLKGRELLHTANPTKFKALQYLIKVHESRGDKILVFCDRPKVIQYYAGQLKYAVIHGDVSSQERYKIYNLFKKTKDLNVIFVSRVGDTAIDLPCANVGIQLGMHFKSRRQQVQRMGRVMRAKDNPYNDYNAFFYTLVSLDTKQVQYSSIRQQTLIGQGFQYQIVLEQGLEYNCNPEKHSYMKQIDQLSFLTRLLTDHSEGDYHLQLPEKAMQANVVRKDWRTNVNMYYDQG